jgi:putative transposase
VTAIRPGEWMQVDSTPIDVRLVLDTGVDALRISRSVLPHRRLTEIDERLEHAAARPVIVPETIVCDHGRVYVSRAFQSACRAMGINFQPTHKGSPWEKSTLKTSFNAVGTLFAQYVAGYVGSSVERRGEKAEEGAVWSVVELQALLDEWIVDRFTDRSARVIALTC